jgi:hypothetical protein
MCEECGSFDAVQSVTGLAQGVCCAEQSPEATKVKWRDEQKLAERGRKNLEYACGIGWAGDEPFLF